MSNAPATTTPEIATITVGIGRWRCEVASDSPEAIGRIERIFPEQQTDYADPVKSRITILFHGGASVRMRVETPGVGDILDRILARPEGKRLAREAGSTKQRYYDVAGVSDSGFEIVDGELILDDESSWGLYTELFVSWLALIESSMLGLHASVTSLDGATFIIIAPSGSGKSTTAWALHKQGASYHGDELVFVDGRDYALFTRCHLLSLRPGGIESLGEEPDSGYWKMAKANDPKFVVAAPSLDSAIGEKVMLVFLNGFADAPILEPISGAQAARKLLGQMGSGAGDFDDRLRAALGLANKFPCFSLTLGTPEQSAAALIARSLSLT